MKPGPKAAWRIVEKERSVTEEISLDEKSVLSFRVSHAGSFSYKRIDGRGKEGPLVDLPLSR